MEEDGGIGLAGACFPRAVGGAGSSYLYLIVLLEEMGRALVPGPFLATVAQAGRVILAAGNEQQKKDYLSRISNGNLIMTFALSEEKGSIEAADINLTADLQGDHYVLSGKKLFVPDANVANEIIVVARTRNSVSKEDGITLFVVDANAKGINTEVLKTITGEKLCEVVFDNVVVPETDVLGEVGKGWSTVKKVLEEATVAECAWMLGGARWVMETTIEYAKTRIQFGHPIGSFQAIQHKLANVAVEVEGCASLTYYAAWAITENDPGCAMAASMAKAWVGDSYKNATFEGVQIHGGIGFTWDHDMHLYLKRAKSDEVLFGDTTCQREKIAQMLKI